NGSNDGTGRVYMLDAMTGALKYTFSAAGGLATGDPGLAQISGLIESDGTVAYAYGGDELGNLWKFDLNKLTVTRIAQLKDASNAPQPVTTAPALTRVNGNVVVLVGTGQLLGLTDMGSTQSQSFYAIKDSGPELTNARSSLAARTFSAEISGRRNLQGTAMDWSTGRGWYFDLPAGQQSNTNPLLVFGSVAFSVNQLSASTCSGASYFYVADITTGLNAAGLDYGSLVLRSDATVSAANWTISSTGIMRGLMQDSTGGWQQPPLPPPPSPPPPPPPGASPRKSAWREVRH
ncbi:MAG TPA: pyrrolo-quinoline quinone, partial [Burkholderiaceae bacterium]